MPKYELKALQREIEQKKLWPVYWIYGAESWKAREAFRWLRQAILGEAIPSSASQSGGGLLGLSEESLEASEVNVSVIIDSANSPSFATGTRLIVIRDAHLLKEADALSSLFGPVLPQSDVPFVCVFLAKDLDGRKKFSKQLIEKAAVVPCEEVAENQRESWIQFLSKKKKLTVEPPLVTRLLSLDPWTLDRVEQELDKWVIGGKVDDVVSSELGGSGEAQAFVDALFGRKFESALAQVQEIATQPEVALPLLGLLTWNLRQLILFLAAQSDPTARSLQKPNPYLLDRLKRWSQLWKMPELLTLQHELADLDFSMKQTPLSPIGLWASVISRCI